MFLNSTLREKPCITCSRLQPLFSASVSYTHLDVYKRQACPRQDTPPEQWQAQVLARVLMRHKVILVSDLVDPALVRGLHMEPAKTVDEALARAYEIMGRDAKVAVIPDGLSVIVNR